ncbi:MAG: hypothetical protein RIB03_00110 [Henriciella sp.]|uniref:hypothetical protein n=1 Tax=Henriciella sp. TaxID=1968823 RepID=UPI0032EEF71E
MRKDIGAVQAGVDIMMIRRLSQHLRTQNWFAVGLDFAIVILGVFIGLQLGNWNAARADRAAYEHALERYQAEIATNLETLDTMEDETTVMLRAAGEAIDALQSCQDDAETLRRINRGINVMMGTSGLSLRDSALDDLTTSPRLLAQQDEAARKRFSDTAYLSGVFLREADFIELIPLDERAQNNPLIRVGALVNRSASYAGVDYSRPDRRLELGVPVSVACEDNMLIKSLFTWERWQSALPAVGRILRAQYEDDLAWLNARR